MSVEGSGPPERTPEIPGFDHIRLIGQGRFAEVHLFQQRFPRRLVAVKVMREQLGWESRHAFELEANALAALSAHPCIVAIHDAGQSPAGVSYLVMEYCPLPSLAQQIRAGSLELEDALRIGILVAGALDTAHAHGLLHRDVKPANVLMTDYGAPQLADFGIATSAADRNVVSGFTPAWAPPELVADATTASVATDVYSLAATVYTMLAGHGPHERPEGPNGAQDVIGRVSEPVPPLAGVPAAVAEVFRQALSLDPRERFRSARMFGAALQTLEAELGLRRTQMVLVDPPRRSTDEQTPAMNDVATMWSEANATRPEQPVRRPWLPLALTAVLVLVLASAAVLAFAMARDDSPDTEAPDPTESPLALDADYANLPCNGEFIVGLGTSEGDDAGVEKLSERLVGITDPKYLKNSESCSEFDASSSTGELYQVYLGPFETFEDACTTRAALQAAEPNEWAYRSWVKHVDVGAKRRELCVCLDRPQDLPRLEVEQPAEEARTNRPVVGDLEHFLWHQGINNSDPPVDDGYYTEQIAEMVRRYQEDEPMAIDGRVTAPVWDHILEDYCADG